MLMLNKIKDYFNILKQSYSKISFENRIRGFGIFNLLLFAALIALTNPDTIGPLGVTTVLGLIYLIITTLILYFKNRKSGDYSTSSHRRSLVIRSALLAVPFIILIALNTIHQLSWRDLVILPILYLAASFYINKQFDV